jgi:hypothetical protein
MIKAFKMMQAEKKSRQLSTGFLMVLALTQYARISIGPTGRAWPNESKPGIEVRRYQCPILISRCT